MSDFVVVSQTGFKMALAQICIKKFGYQISGQPTMTSNAMPLGCTSLCQ